MKKLLSLGLILLLMSVLFAGCKKDKGDPPVLPPAESMTIDFSNFDPQKKSGDLKGIENSAWLYSATIAGTWSYIINKTLLVPVTSFQLAINQPPEYLSKNNWQWSYDVPVANSTYKARLTGEIRSGDVAWKMYVTKEGTGGFAEFLWFEGTSKLDGAEGQWILNESSVSPTPILQIDWTKTASAIGKITYKFVKIGDARKDSYIEYGLTNNILNAYYKIKYWNGVQLWDVDVEWSTTLKNGRIKSFDYILHDNGWHCWGANKDNVNCP